MSGRMHLASSDVWGIIRHTRQACHKKAFLGHISTFMFTLQRLCQSRQEENKQIWWRCFGINVGFDDAGISQIVPLEHSLQKSNNNRRHLVHLNPFSLGEGLCHKVCSLKLANFVLLKKYVE